MTGARKRWRKGRHRWKWLRPKNWPIGRARREADALATELAMWDDRPDDEAMLNFRRLESGRRAL